MIELPGYLHERAAEVINSAFNAVEELRDKIKAASLPTEAERRKYALLHAAAILTQFHCQPVLGTSRVEMNINHAVDHARQILEQIERTDTPSHP